MYFKSYYNAENAFEDLYDHIINNGELHGDTKALFNVGIKIENPIDNSINTKWRKWKSSYAEYEWDWYLSKNPNAINIAKIAKIWNNMMDENGNVNSNYGYQWSRSDQLNKVISLIKANKETRRASISIYDGKEIDLYDKDTPCTYAINFYISRNKLFGIDELNMQVMMRSNDLIYGFCNDQYCFSKLHKFVSDELNINIGNYFHFACNMHIYNKHLNLKSKI